MDDEMLFDLNAASWRHGHADELAFVEVLASRLEKSLPGLAVVEREHRLFSKAHPVTKIEVRFDQETYLLALEGGRPVGRRAKAVRGIVLSTQTLPMKEWLEEFSRALSRYARENEDARRSLEEFLL